jgi:hypothetical protein
MRTLCKVHPYEDLRRLPELYEINNVLPYTDECTGNGDEFRPGEGCEPWGVDAEPDRRVHPFHEVERDEEEFVACAHEEQSTLFLRTRSIWAAEACERRKTHGIIVVVP